MTEKCIERLMKVIYYGHFTNIFTYGPGNVKYESILL